ncbi:MAG TPA: tRNA(Ile)(2)-agmatinylcytidine synthase [Methanocorpusculum sp.]|nr:tRNA(Ile)(2)-agmatinylcytidine synthase [Methanocorpusculum sp.]
MYTSMFLGLDDTDSPDGMCTTYLGALIAEALEKQGCVIKNMRLIRLNPNVPWKTRGNASVCIEFDGSAEIASQTADEFIEKYAMFDCQNTNPGFVVCETKPSPDFYYSALRTFCTVDEAKAVLDSIGAVYKGYKNCWGLIGALAAVSAELSDKTYEYLAYRKPEAFGTQRVYDVESFRRSAEETYPHCWDTWDFAAEKPVCVPHGKDPVLYGIRGRSPEWVEKAVSYLSSEEVERFVIWETNQCTDAHILSGDSGFEEGRSYVFDGVVTSAPKTQRGGHVSFSVNDMLCYAFEPTKSFRNTVRKLIEGDELTVFGSFQNGVIHVEKFCLNAAAKKEVRISPKCPVCGGRMTSAGKGKGYKCRECSGRVREVESEPRDISEGWYEVPPDARRHLSKPICRMSDLE